MRGAQGLIMARGRLDQLRDPSLPCLARRQVQRAQRRGHVAAVLLLLLLLLGKAGVLKG
jgi:hypothetical protein